MSGGPRPSGVVMSMSSPPLRHLPRGTTPLLLATWLPCGSGARREGITTLGNPMGWPAPSLGEHLAFQRVIAVHRGSAMTEIKEHMEVIGADGAHIGTVDKVEGGRIKLTKKDSGEGSHKGHHHFIDKGLVAGVEGNKVRLSANGNVAVTMEQEK